MTETDANLYRITQPRDALWRVYWEGNLVDAHPAEKAEKLFIELSRDRSFNNSAEVEIDLMNCGTVNTAGLAFLIYLRRRLRTNGNHWVVSNVPLLLKRMFCMLNLESAFEVSSRYTIDPEDEDNAFDAIERDSRRQIDQGSVEIEAIVEAGSQTRDTLE